MAGSGVARLLCGVGLVAVAVTACASGASTAPTRTATGTSQPTPVTASTIDPAVQGTPNLSTRGPLPTPTPSPTPTPAPTPFNIFGVIEAQLIKSCASGSPIPAAAKYTGSGHPVMELMYGGTWELNAFAVDGELAVGYPKPIQLVACIGTKKTVKIGSCGTYQESGTGKVGTLLRYHYLMNITIRNAKTGKVIKTKALYGSTPSCSGGFTYYGDNPPWRIYGSDPDYNKYVESFSK